MTVTGFDDWNYVSDSSREQLEDDCHGPTYAYTTASQTLKRLSIFVFGFTCHQNVFVLINELRAPTVSRMDKAILISIGTAFVAYLAVAVGGYYTFGDGVSGDILLNYPKTLVVTLMRTSIAILVILSYPMQLDPARRCLLSLIQAIRGYVEDRQGQWCRWRWLSTRDEITEPLLPVASLHGRRARNESERDSTNTNNSNNSSSVVATCITKTFTIVTCVFLVLSLLIAVVVSDLGIVLAVVGATGSTTVSYILPGIMYLKLHNPMGVGQNYQDRRDPLWFMAWIQLILGLMIVPISLYFVLFGSDD